VFFLGKPFFVGKAFTKQAHSWACLKKRSTIFHEEKILNIDAFGQCYKTLSMSLTKWTKKIEHLSLTSIASSLH
jgi:hypothetical protein